MTTEVPKDLEEISDKELIAKMADQMLWMTGSADFGPGGQAHTAFMRSTQPVMHEGMRRTPEYHT